MCRHCRRSCCGARSPTTNYTPPAITTFTLKDSQCSLKCVMFRGSAARLRFRPENGMQVIASGRISVYPRDGAYQLYCTGLTPGGRRRPECGL